MVNWDAPDIKEWKKKARTTQQEYQDLLGDREWDVIEKAEITLLRRKVGFGLYGPPSDTPKAENEHTGYNKDQLEQIHKICDQLVENLNFQRRDIHFACIFVTGKIFDDHFTAPVFKAKRENEKSSSCVYVDSGARKYASWSDYLENNKLPKCIYCYPLGGIYKNDRNNEVCVKFGTSPACDFISRVLSFFDGVATVVTLGATGVGVAALCAIPIAGPVMAATAVAGISTSVYGVARSSHALYDRATHGQSIGLDDSDARGFWIAIVGSSLGFAQGRMISSIADSARAGEVMGKAGRIAFMIVQTGSLTINGIGIVHGLAVLIDKNEQNTLTSLDVFQFSASLLFFTNAAVNLKTAGTLIKEIQHDVINSHREGLSPDARKLFNKHTGKLRGPDEMHGNAKVVKQLNRVENSHDLYEMMVDKSNIRNNKVKLTQEGYKGMLEVNKNLKIHPLKLLEIDPKSRQSIFEATKNYANGSLPREQFRNQMAGICRKYQISFESMRQETAAKLCQLYGTTKLSDITVGRRKIFANVTPHEMDRLRVVLENTAQDNPEIMAIATEFAKTRGCTSAKEFINYAEYFAADLNETVKTFERHYQVDLEAAKAKPGFSQAKFDKARGIEGARKQHHKEMALESYRDGVGYEELNQRFETLKDRVGLLNRRCEPGFFSDDAASYHYLKHKDFGKAGELTPEEYFKVAEEVVGNPTNRTNAMLSQDGSCTMITYIAPQNGVRAIKIDRHSSGGDVSGIATVMYDKKVLQ